MVKSARKGERKAWDPIELWAYVLGEEEEEEDRKIRLFRRQDRVKEGDGILSYILPGGGEGESREESLQNEGTLEESYASVEESREEESENRSVVASLFSWGSTKHDEEPKEEEQQWEWQLDPAILVGVAKSESEKSDESTKRRSLLSRSKSEPELASKGQNNSSSHSLKRESTVGKWLDSSAIDYSSSNDDDTGDDSDDTDDEPWILGVTDEILGLSAEEESQRRREKTKRGGSLLGLGKKKEPPPQDIWSAMTAGLSSSEDASRKERASVASDKSSNGEPRDQFSSIRGMMTTRRDSTASDQSKEQFDQQSWGILGLASSNETPRSFSGSLKTNRKRGASDEKPKDNLSVGSWMSAGAEGDASAKKKERRGLLAIGKSKAEKYSAKTTVKDDTSTTSKKKERRGWNIRMSKSDQSKASDNTKKNKTDKAKQSSSAVMPDKMPSKKGRRSLRLRSRKSGKSGSNSSLGVGLLVEIEEASDSEGLALEPEMSEKRTLTEGDMEKCNTNTEKLPTKVEADETSGLGKVEAWLFGIDSGGVEDTTKANETCKPATSVVPDGAKLATKPDEPKNHSGKSWLFSVLSHEEEPMPKDGRSLLMFESPELCANIGGIDDETVPPEVITRELKEQSWLSRVKSLEAKPDSVKDATAKVDEIEHIQTAEPSASKTKGQSGESWLFGVKSLEEEPKKKEKMSRVRSLSKSRKSKSSASILQTMEQTPAPKPSGTAKLDLSWHSALSGGEAPEGERKKEKKRTLGLSRSKSRTGLSGLSFGRSKANNKSEKDDRGEEDADSWMSSVKIVVNQHEVSSGPSHSMSIKTDLKDERSALDSIKSEPKETDGASWLFGGKSPGEDPKQGRRSIGFGRSKKTIETTCESIESKPNKQNSESWLFAVKSQEEEPKQRQRGINFGRSKNTRDTTHETESWLFGGKSVNEEPNQKRHGISFSRSKKANDCNDPPGTKKTSESEPREQSGASWLIGGNCPEEELKKGRRSLSFSRSKKADDLDNLDGELELKESELQHQNTEYWLFGPKSPKEDPKKKERVHSKKAVSQLEAEEGEPQELWLCGAKSIEEVEPKKARQLVSFGRSKKADDFLDKLEPKESVPQHQETESWLSCGAGFEEVEPEVSFGCLKKAGDREPKESLPQQQDTESWLFGVKSLQEVEPTREKRRDSIGCSKKADNLDDLHEPRESELQHQNTESWLFGAKTLEEAEPKKERRGLSFGRSKKANGVEECKPKVSELQHQNTESLLFGIKTLGEAEPKKEKEQQLVRFGCSKKADDLDECEPKESELQHQNTESWLFGMKTLEEAEPKKEKSGLNFGQSKKANNLHKGPPKESELQPQNTESWLFGTKSIEEAEPKKEKQFGGFGRLKKADKLEDLDECEPRKSELQHQNTDSWLFGANIVEEVEPKKEKRLVSFGRSKGKDLDECEHTDSELQHQNRESRLFGMKSLEEEPKKAKPILSLGRSKEAGGLTGPNDVHELKESEQKDLSRKSWLFGVKSLEEDPKKAKPILSLGHSKETGSSTDPNDVHQLKKCEPKEHSRESWLFGKSSPDEESNQGRRGLIFGSSQSRAFEASNQNSKLQTACESNQDGKSRNGRSQSKSKTCESSRESNCAAQKANEAASSGHIDQSRESFVSTSMKNNNPSSLKEKGDLSESSKKKGDRVRPWSLRSKLAKKIGPSKTNKATASGEKEDKSKQIQERKHFSRSTKKEEEREQPSWFSRAKVNTTNKQDDQQEVSWLFGQKSVAGTQGRESSASDKTKPKENGQRRAWFSGDRNKSETPPDEGVEWIWTIGPAIWPTIAEPKSEDLSSAKSKRRVRFAGIRKKRSEKEPEVATSGWQSAQTLIAGFKDWVAASSSDDTCEDEEKSSSIQPPALHQKVPEVAEVEVSASNQGEETTEAEFGMGGIFSSWVASSSSDEAEGATTSSGASTSYSSVSSDSTTSDEATGERTTHQDEGTSIVDTVQEQDIDEVRLVFRPITDDEDPAGGDDQRDMPMDTPVTVDPISILPAADFAHEKHHLYFDGSSTDDSVSQKEYVSEQANQNRETMDQISEDNVSQQNEEAWTAHFEDVPSVRSVEQDECVESAFDDPLDFSRGQLNWKVCCSMKNLSPAQQRWSAKSGIPFHELSQQELAAIFPKVKSVSDQQQRELPTELGDPRGFDDYSANLEADPNFSGPRSIFQYEYETGIHMFVSYDKFGSISSGKLPFQVTTAMVPRLLANEAGTNSVVVQVEASMKRRNEKSHVLKRWTHFILSSSLAGVNSLID